MNIIFVPFFLFKKPIMIVYFLIYEKSFKNHNAWVMKDIRKYILPMDSTGNVTFL